MVRESSVATRNQAMGMLKAGSKQESLARQLGKTAYRTSVVVQGKERISLENLQGRGRKTVIGNVTKIVIAKTLGKKRKSTRKISKILKNKGIQVFHMTVHSYLRKNLGVKPFKPQLQPKLTEKQKNVRLSFCRERKKWSVHDWRKVLFSDESPFELCYSLNRQNDRVWLADRLNLLPTETVKFPGKVHLGHVVL